MSNQQLPLFTIVKCANPKPDTIEHELKMSGFTIRRTTVTYKDQPYTTFNLTLTSDELIKYFKKLINSSSGYYESYDAKQLFKYYNEFANYKASEDKPKQILQQDLKQLIKFYDVFYEKEFGKIKAALKSNKLEFSHLGHFYEIGKEYLLRDIDSYIIGRLKKKQWGFSGSNEYVTLTFSVIDYDHKDKTYIEKSTARNIWDYEGTIDADKLSVTTFTADLKDKLTTRGMKYIKMVDKIGHYNFSGFRYSLNQYGGYKKTNASGRIIIDDADSYQQIKTRNSDSYDREKKTILKDISNDYHRLPAFLVGYSLNHLYGWAWFDIENITPIVYNKSAFDKVVMPTQNAEFDVKSALLKIINSKKNINYKDLIDGKNSGLIILLSGPPGVGKTLLAEATAEILERPLYRINIGQLGSTAEKIESLLPTYLEYSDRWRAITLMDEADAYLEKRKESESMERNSTVSVFLRHLENNKPNNIIYLTSNRGDSLDPAFDSRISIKIKYNDLDQDNRKQIWKNLLANSNIELKDSELETLSTYKINGRHITNTIKLAMCIVGSEKIGLDDLVNAISMMNITCF